MVVDSAHRAGTDRREATEFATTPGPAPGAWLPLREATAAALLVFATAWLSSWVVRSEAERAYQQQVITGMVAVAHSIAAVVDVEALLTLDSPSMSNGPEFEAVAAPMRRVVSAIPGLKYAYTMKPVDGRMVFLVDPTPPGDADHDGVEDHVNLFDPYDDAPESAFRAATERTTTWTEEPYTDKWGSFLSVWHPLFTNNGEFACVLGVDMSAERYQQEMAAIEAASARGVLVAAFAALVLGFGFWLARRATHQAQEAQRAAIRELALAKGAAEAANRTKSEFLANMSHEIRTPMTAILGYAELLREDSAGRTMPSDQLQYLDTIERNADHLLAILDDILDLSKIEAGRLEVETASLCPVTMIRDVVQLMQVKAEAKHVELRVTFASKMPPAILTDPVRLRQILMNLVGNAIKFTDQGSVTIRTAWDDAQQAIRFSVVDTGIGMSAEQLSRLFQPFEQADSSTTRRYGGTGLGLRISKRLAELLGGDISVVSAPGAGSEFRLTIRAKRGDAAPLAQPEVDPATGASPPAESKPTASSLQGVEILLAEDGIDNQRLIAEMLRRSGARIDVVANGREAVEALLGSQGETTAKAYDLLLLDMQMPVMDGYTTARHLREHGCRVPIVALTANAMTGDREACLACGCDEFLSKPVDRAELVAMCVDLVAGRSVPSR